MATIDLSGTGVALITPFHEDKTVDFDALGRLLDSLMEGGVDYLVVLGTTSENPTLEPQERDEIKRFVVEKTAGRLPLVLGVGGNNTAAVVRELRTADFTGYSAVLSVVPFYNKPSQEGIYAHYACIAKASPLPVILYNVPGRTGVNMEARTTLQLAEDFHNIVAVKEASGNMNQVDEIIRHMRPGFKVISGDDAITFPLITLGAAGVISVIGNAFPREFSTMVRLALAGDYERARKIHHRFSDLFRLLFVDGNPAGVKCALHQMGMCENELRLPLVPTRIATNERIHHVLDSLRLTQSEIDTNGRSGE
ncbi:MAG: 4-hydroxy-tetrahydrodipicolinate synthase [Bacteroides sp.]|nr:4-hydroxy-tetrahydrodipicolinate synthase [Bacteroides sp.]MCM1413281.1 4-hydroxy-tetrahydrodipicolinate synthase [Bacteroides sp.]MCM1471409.1 4-hydroxy-tetrahydrodipicolinate synthase [Bacteroides sp.]